MARPGKTKYPVSLEVALRLAMPKKRLEDRFKFFRMFIQKDLQLKLGRPPSKEEVEQGIADAQHKRYTELETHNFRTAIFPRLIPEFEDAIRKKRAQIAAAKRWKRKPLD